MFKKLLLFSNQTKKALTAVFFLALSNGYSAQIVYQDITDVVSPQPTQFTSIYNVDFDSNFQTDNTLQWKQEGNNWVVHNDTFNKIVGATNFATPLALNTSINSSSPFLGPSIGWGNIFMNDFLDQGDKYIGCQFKKLNLFYYGWILVNFSTVNNVKTLTIKSLAYNSTPGEPILAGQTTALSVEDVSNKKRLGIYPNPVKSTIYLKENSQNSTSQISSFSIFNSAGQLIKKENASVKDNIDVSGLSKGVYYLQLTDKKSLKPQNIKFIKE